MPEPPSVSIITKYLFDTPWPIVVICGVFAAVCLMAWRSTRKRELAVAPVVLALLAIIVVLVERWVVTSGENAETIVHDLVRAAEQGDVATGAALFADDAIMSLVDPKNPGVGLDDIRRRLELVRRRYAITRNSITSLRTYSQQADRGVVHMRVRTEFESSYGYPVLSAWVISVKRHSDGVWKIDRITFVEFNGRSPSSSIFR